MFRLISPNSWVFFSALLLFLFQRRLDILKIDVEGAEWPSLAEMMKSKSMDDVRQLMVEFHIWGDIRYIRKTAYSAHLSLLRELYTRGFRIFFFRMWSTKSTMNGSVNADNIARTRFHEVHFMRTIT